jgi:hypothetical protein
MRRQDQSYCRSAQTADAEHGIVGLSGTLPQRRQNSTTRLTVAIAARCSATRIIRIDESSARWFKARIEETAGRCDGHRVGETARAGFAHFRNLGTVGSDLDPAQIEE